MLNNLFILEIHNILNNLKIGIVFLNIKIVLKKKLKKLLFLMSTYYQQLGSQKDLKKKIYLFLNF